MPTVNTKASQYRLAAHVRACSVDEQVILLDLRQNRYLAISGPQASRLSGFITDWPAREVSGSRPSAVEQVSPWLDTLRDRALLEPADGQRQTAAAMKEALDSIHTDLSLRAGGIDWWCLPALARAAAGASYWLRQLSLAEIVERVASLRPPREVLQAKPDVTELASAVSTYEKLRPLLFTAHDQCLHDSLTLTRFLAPRQMFPRWVVGVKTRPFGAHSWVQADHLVINDALEHVRRYTPILVV